MIRPVHNAVETVQNEIRTWDSPFVELDCFGTDDAEQIVGMIDDLCRAHLASGIRGYFFYRATVGSTHGVQLEDGRDVVIKIRPPAETNPYISFDRPSLERVCQVMKWLADRGYPCPEPIVGPTPFARGLATVEEFLNRGERDNGFGPECGKLIATGLAELIELLRSFEGKVSCLKHF
jgi:hypothetical protein